MDSRSSLYYLDRKKILDPQQTYLIGREKNCDIFLDEKTVSRKHAELYFANEQWTIKDLDSTNGTTVNYNLSTHYNLSHGDKIQIGPFILLLREENVNTNELDSMITDTLLLERKLQKLLDYMSSEEEKNAVYDLKHFLNNIRYRMDLLANKDKLTGLHNRSYFDHQLLLELERAKRYGESCFLLMIDIDHFKKFNDQHGHQVGDKVLAAVSKIIRNNLRKNDISARYGGEEIAVILPRIDNDHAISTAEKLRMTIQSESKSITGLEVTVSIGVASSGNSGDSPEKIISNSDKALYKAKERGRNKAVLYNPSSNS